MQYLQNYKYEEINEDILKRPYKRHEKQLPDDSPYIFHGLFNF